MADMTVSGGSWLRKRVEAGDQDFLRDLVKTVVEALMSADADGACGASYGAVSPDRVNQRNGYRERRWDTRVGSIPLAVPKLRHGSYFPDWLLEPRRRAERCLVQVIAECYVRGVSTRRVDGLVKTLGIAGISKSQVSELATELDARVEEFRDRPLTTGPYPYLWLDAMTQRSREGGRVLNVATVVATGVNREGKREILGMDVMTSEDGAGWTAFLRGLVARGLTGAQLVISDAHAGLKDAIASVFPGAAWQRCRAHFMRNLLTKVAKSAQDFVQPWFVRSMPSLTPRRFWPSMAGWSNNCGAKRHFRTPPTSWRMPGRKSWPSPASPRRIGSKLVEQSAGAAQQGNSPAHRRGWHLPGSCRHHSVGGRGSG